MAKITFFPLAASPTLGEIAHWTGATLAEGADPERIVRDVAPLDEAGPGRPHLSRQSALSAAFARPAPARCSSRRATPRRRRRAAPLLVDAAALSRDGGGDGAALSAGRRPRSAFGEPGVSPAALSIRRRGSSPASSSIPAR